MKEGERRAMYGDALKRHTRLEGISKLVTPHKERFNISPPPPDVINSFVKERNPFESLPELGSVTPHKEEA